MMYDEDYDYDYDNDLSMSDDELLYREMNPEDPWYMGPADDGEIYDFSGDDQSDDWD